MFVCLFGSCVLFSLWNFACISRLTKTLYNWPGVFKRSEIYQQIEKNKVVYLSRNLKSRPSWTILMKLWCIIKLKFEYVPSRICKVFENQRKCLIKVFWGHWCLLRPLMSSEVIWGYFMLLMVIWANWGHLRPFKINVARFARSIVKMRHFEWFLNTVDFSLASWEILDDYKISSSSARFLRVASAARVITLQQRLMGDFVS